MNCLPESIPPLRLRRAFFLSATHLRDKVIAFAFVYVQNGQANLIATERWLREGSIIVNWTDGCCTAIYMMTVNMKACGRNASGTVRQKSDTTTLWVWIQARSVIKITSLIASVASFLFSLFVAFNAS